MSPNLNSQFVDLISLSLLVIEVAIEKRRRIEDISHNVEFISIPVLCQPSLEAVSTAVPSPLPKSTKCNCRFWTIVLLL